MLIETLLMVYVGGTVAEFARSAVRGETKDRDLEDSAIDAAKWPVKLWEEYQQRKKAHGDSNKPNDDHRA